MAIQSRKVFIDSTVLIAFIDRADQNHLKVVKVFEDLASLKYQLFINLQIIQDAYLVLNREVGGSVALDFLQAILTSDIEIIFPQKADLITAHRILRSNRDRQIMLREALIATLMQKKNVNQILTFSYWHNLLGTHVSNLLTI